MTATSKVSWNHPLNPMENIMYQTHCIFNKNQCSLLNIICVGYFSFSEVVAIRRSGIPIIFIP